MTDFDAGISNSANRTTNVSREVIPLRKLTRIRRIEDADLCKLVLVDVSSFEGDVFAIPLKRGQIRLAHYWHTMVAMEVAYPSAIEAYRAAEQFDKLGCPSTVVEAENALKAHLKMILEQAELRIPRAPSLRAI